MYVCMHTYVQTHSASFRAYAQTHANTHTGKLATEYLKEKNYPIKWGVCGRNAAKVKDVLDKLGVDCPIEVADLVVEEGSEPYETLRGVVKKANVVLTCAGPFEKYGLALVRLCVEEGVCYSQIKMLRFYQKILVVILTLVIDQHEQDLMIAQ